ncbi:MAG: AAA family ATPase, partial [Oscillospiraceae bacterium]|nr:AAA family ATPase [Oscillospiraceae bacterium]
MEDGKTINEGLCLKCAKDMNIKPVNDMMEKMGIGPDDLDNISNEISEMMEDENFSEGGAASLGGMLGNIFNSAAMETAAEEDAAEDESPDESDADGEKKKKPKKRKFLDGYCINLTQKARDGKIDNIVGRNEEIFRVVQILNRRTKNNPCLIGEPGESKTAIPEGLAKRIAEGDAPARLLDKEVYLLDLTALVAGTQFRGQFESRVKGLIEEIKKVGNIILVIDEVHTLVGTGDAEGSMNAANMLKPALSRGEIQVIGATTLAEYRKYIEKDAALERRFQPIIVEEPSIEDAVQMLEGIKKHYEQYHGLVIPDEIVRKAVSLSERYLTDRFLPDKA